MTNPLRNLRVHPGWTGLFTRDEAPGGHPNGSRVIKTTQERGDAHAIGAAGTVLGSFLLTYEPGVGYFVEWDDAPRTAVFCLDAKITLQP